MERLYYYMNSTGNAIWLEQIQKTLSKISAKKDVVDANSRNILLITTQQDNMASYLANQNSIRANTRAQLKANAASGSTSLSILRTQDSFTKNMVNSL
jgi:hypothetical protein